MSKDTGPLSGSGDVVRIIRSSSSASASSNDDDPKPDPGTEEIGGDLDASVKNMVS